jgi:hypothetical protein
MQGKRGKGISSWEDKVILDCVRNAEERGLRKGAGITEASKKLNRPYSVIHRRYYKKIMEKKDVYVYEPIQEIKDSTGISSESIAAYIRNLEDRIRWQDIELAIAQAKIADLEAMKKEFDMLVGILEKRTERPKFKMDATGSVELA